MSFPIFLTEIQAILAYRPRSVRTIFGDFLMHEVFSSHKNIVQARHACNSRKYDTTVENTSTKQEALLVISSADLIFHKAGWSLSFLVLF